MAKAPALVWEVTKPTTGAPHLARTQPWPYVATDPNLQPVAFPVEAINPAPTVNAMTNFGWEYVWHCHLLGHEEADMMRPLVMTQVGATSTADTIAPTVTAAVSPAPNAAGWNKTAPTVTLTATDNLGGAGLASSTFSATGVNTYSGKATVPPISPATLTADCTSIAGITTVSYFATDSAATPNSSAPANLAVRWDGTPPTWAPGSPTVSE